MSLQVADCEAEDGTIYGAFYFEDFYLGIADKIGDAWKVGRSKSLLSTEQAARTLIEFLIRDARKQESHAQGLLTSFKTQFFPRDQVKRK